MMIPKRVSFRTILTNHQRENMSEAEQNDLLMRMARDALAREILEVDGAIHIDTRYDIATRDTMIDHSVVVLVEEK